MRVITIIMVLIYTHLGHVSLLTVIIVTVVMFVGIFSRMIPSQALMSAIPEPTKRGSFNAISASLQQISGGIASVIAGVTVTQGADGRPPTFRSPRLHRRWHDAAIAGVDVFHRQSSTKGAIE